MYTMNGICMHFTTDWVKNM